AERTPARRRAASPAREAARAGVRARRVHRHPGLASGARPRRAHAHRRVGGRGAAPGAAHHHGLHLHLPHPHPGGGGGGDSPGPHRPAPLRHRHRERSSGAGGAGAFPRQRRPVSLDRARRGARWSGCLVILLGLLAPVPPAWAGDCGACALSGLPSSRDLRFGLFPGELVADVSVAGSFGARREVTAEGTPVRDAGLWFENRWVALLGFSHSLGLELEVPLHAGLTSSTRTPALGQADAAQASRTGLGDTWLSLRFARPVGAWTVLATAGLGLPTGTGAALRGAEGGPDERALAVTAFGSGTWDPLLKLALTRRLGPLELVAVGQGRIRGMGAAEARAPATRLFGSVG